MHTVHTATIEKPGNNNHVEEDKDAAIAGVQAAVLSHGARVATLAAARARGGIYTARPWQAAKESETESENEDLIENLQVTYKQIHIKYEVFSTKMFRI